MTAIPPRTLERSIHGQQTDILVQTFADRILVLITQFGKVGNLVQATLPSTIPLNPPNANPFDADRSEFPVPSPAIQLTPLLGSAISEELRALQALYASQVATIVWTMESSGLLEGSRRPVVVGIALKHNSSGINDTRGTYLDIMKMLVELLQQG